MATFNDPSDDQGIRDNIGSLNPFVTALGNITGATTVTHSYANQVFTATLTGNVTFTFAADTTADSTPTAAGDRITLILTQDGTGSRTATWPGTFKKAGGTLTLTTTAGAKDLVEMVYDGTNWNEVGRSLALA